MRDGLIVQGRSDVAGEHLGDVLVRRGLLSRADLDRAVEEVLARRRPLGAVLTGLSLIDEASLGGDQADQCLRLAGIATSDSSFVAQVRELGVEHELLDVGLAELEAVLTGCAGLQSDRFAVEASLSLARGLDYYTGTVFEIYMEGFEFLKSVGGGGRYDALASDGRTNYPGVGISFGISRTLVPLINRGLLTADRKVPSVVLVALVDEESRPASDAIAEALRSRGIACEVAATAQRFGKQIRYAERRGIPYVWFTGGDGATDEGQVKDIRTGHQQAADPASWMPLTADLRPQVTIKEQLT